MKGVRVEDGWIFGIAPVPFDELEDVFEDLERHGFRVVRAEVVGETLFIRTKTKKRR